MARISRYQQDKIISALAPVGPVDQSGAMVANTVSDAARQASGLAVDAQNRNYAANQAINQQFFTNFTHGLRVRQFYKNQAEAHEQQVLQDSEITQRSLDLNLRLDDEANTVKEANRQAPHLANQAYRESSQALVDNYVKENKLTPEVALAVRKAANSKIQSEFASLNTYAYNQKVENLKAANINNNKEILTRMGSNADPNTLISGLASIKQKEGSLAWLTADEAAKETRETSQAGAFNWAKKYIDTVDTKGSKELLDKIDADPDKNTFEGILAEHLPREQRDTLIKRWEARDAERVAKEKEDAEAYKEDMRLGIDAARFTVPNDPNVSAQKVQEGKIRLMDIRSELINELKNPDITAAKRKVVTGLIEDTSTNIRAIENEDIQRKNNLYTLQQRDYAAETRDYVLQQRGRAEVSYQESQTKKEEKKVQTSPEADQAVVSITSRISKISKFMNDSKDAKTTVSMTEISQVADDIEANRKYLTNPQYRDMKAKVSTLMEIRKAQGEGDTSKVRALLAGLFGGTTKPAAAAPKESVDSVARKTRLKDVARTYHEIQFRKNPKIGDKPLNPQQLRALEALAEKDAQQGIDWSDAE